MMEIICLDEFPETISKKYQITASWRTYQLNVRGVVNYEWEP